MEILVQDANKYLFDLNNFDHGAGFNPDEPPVPTYSEDELNRAKAQSFADGEKKGLADAQASRDQQIVTLTQKLTADMTRLFAAEGERAARFEQELIKLTRTMFAQAFPILKNHVALDQAEKTIRDVIASLEESSAVIIEVSAVDQDELSSRLKSFLSAHVGQVTILPATDISSGSFRMRWKDGGAIRDIEGLAARIVDVLGRTLAEPDQNRQS